jgi:Tol biopolymer transport system component
MSITILRLVCVALASTVSVGMLAGSAQPAADRSAASAPTIVFHSRLRHNNEIFAVASNGSGLVRLTRSQAIDANPTWSPTGKKIAFESNRHGNWSSYRDSDIYVMNANGSGVRELTFSNGFDGDPAWSRTNRIAFESERGGAADIYSIAPDGAQERRLTTAPAFDGDPAWSPDGSRVAFTSEREGGDREIYVMNADGTDQTRLTTSAGFDENPSWSPDGTRIAFDSTRDGNLEVYVMKTDGSDVQRVTDHPAIDAIPSWSPDSKRILFVSERIAKGQRRLFSVKPDGTGLKQVTRGAYDMSPDWARG